MYPVLFHYFKQGEGRIDIVAIIAHGDRAALPYRFESREVYHRVKAFFGKHLIHRGTIRDVQLIQYGTGTGDCFDAIEHLRGAVIKIVGDDNFNARLDHFNGGMAADVACAAGQ